MADVNFRTMLPGGVKSVQSGYTSVELGATVNITISAVDLSKSVWIAVTAGELYNIQLTSPTNLRVQNASSGFGGHFSWQVIEYY